jgi:gentisate 1,2-dioxygenase
MSSPPPTDTHMATFGTPTELDPTVKLLQEINGADVEPLWSQMAKFSPSQPKPKASSHLWRYAVLRPLLLRAGELVSEEEAERRVLMLINPSVSAPCTTDTLFAGLQLVLPGFSSICGADG